MWAGKPNVCPMAKLLTFTPFQIVSLWDMLERYARQYFKLAQSLEAIKWILLHDAVAQEELSESVSFWLRPATEACRKLNLDVAKQQLFRIVRYLSSNNPPDRTELRRKVEELSDRIEDQLHTRMFLYVPSELIAKYEGKELFGPEVEQKLSRATTDIAEAGKCISLRRSTASVFHLMRVMEVGVQEFGTKLGVTFAQDKVWNTIVEQAAKTAKQLPEATPQEKEYKEECSLTCAHLDNVRGVWRNNTMHPKTSYTEEESEIVFTHVRTFMRSLAKLL
jgi:hypothetical protein